MTTFEVITKRDGSIAPFKSEKNSRGDCESG